jgi:hypothetical protein
MLRRPKHSKIEVVAPKEEEEEEEVFCSKTLLRKRAFYEIMRKNIVEQARSQVTGHNIKRHMCIACWMNKATHSPTR